MVNPKDDEETKGTAAGREPEEEVGRQMSSSSGGRSYAAEGVLPLPRLLRPFVYMVARIKASVHVKLLAGFLVGALLLLGMGMLSLVVINRMSQRVGELNDLHERVDRSGQMLYLVTAQSHFRGMGLVCELADPPSTVSPDDCTADPPWNDRIATAKMTFVEHLDAVDRISSPEEDEVFRRLREANERFALSSEKALDHYDAGEINEAVNVHMLEEHAISHELEAALNGLIGDSREQVSEATAAFKSDRRVLTTVVATFSGISLVLALSLGVVLSSAFVWPVRRIGHVLARIADGDFTQLVEVPNRDEFGTLSRRLNYMTGELARVYAELRSLNENLQDKVKEQVRELEREVRGRERIEQELGVAHDIQLAFLPKELPHPPGWQVETYYQPARAVGGDFYDFIDLPGSRLGIVVGDASDKGVPAALVMCATRSMLRAAAQQLDSPGAVLAQVNELLYRDIPPNMFVTCLYAILDLASGKIRFANAGHNLPYLRADAGVVELRATGMPLGLMPGMTYEEKQATLVPGNSVLLHSDGLVEAHNAHREMFGFPRLMELVGKHPGGAELIDLLVDELGRFTGASWEQEDDVTLVTIQRAVTLANSATATVPSTESDAAPTNGGERILADFTLPSEPGNECVAIERVVEALRGLHLPRARLERLKTAVAEATMNAMEHGNRYRPDLPVSIRVVASDTALSVEIIDHGGGQPIPDPKTPDLEAKLAGHESPRGWGLFLIKNMVDEMRVTSDETHHAVDLIIYLEAEQYGD